jgi:PBSX family phage terminase large subunit
VTAVEPLVGKQARSVHLATARINIWEGSVRSSKTICSLLAWLQYTRTGPAGNLVMVGRTERTLKRNIIDPLVEMLGPKRCRYVAGEGEVWILGRRIYVAGANDERAQEKIRGLTLAGAYVDEVSIVPESFWSMLLTRCSIDGARIFGTSNPDSKNHWLMRDFLSKASTWLRHDGTIHTNPDGMDLHRFSFRLADNPTLSAAYIAALEREFSGLWHKRFIQGLWVVAEGAIYDMWDEDRHLVGALPVDAGGRTDADHWILAIEYGTVNPFAALLIGVGGDDRLYVAGEYRHDSKATRRQLTDAEYSTELRRWLIAEMGGREDAPNRLEGIYVDPSAASFQAQLHRDGWQGVRGADNAVADGIRDVASLLGTDRLRIHDTCTGLREELPGYSWDPKAALKGEERPLKIDDHSVDALRYGVRAGRRWWRHWLTDELPAAA